MTGISITKTYLERVLIVAGDDNVTFHNFHTLDSGQFNGPLQRPLFLKDKEKHLVSDFSRTRDHGQLTKTRGSCELRGRYVIAFHQPRLLEKRGVNLKCMRSSSNLPLCLS